MPRMSTFILHLETSTRICSVALSKDGICIAHLDQSGDGYIHGEALTLMIQELLSGCQLDLQQVAAVSYSSGPGSYTGLRIGLSTAKGLCYALNIPLIGLPTHQILFELAHSFGGQTPQYVIALLDARRTEVYMQVFDHLGTSKKQLHCALLESTDISVYLPALIVGDANQKAQEYWQNDDITWVNTALSAKYQAKIAFRAFEKQTFEDLAYCSPIYLKGANGVLL
jgi:tRNA threonylcarbamoyladenosine biosynthesis protein TsaB